jgi:CRP/FNR family transcriptional regulator
MHGDYSHTASYLPPRESCAGCGLAAWLEPARLGADALAKISCLSEHKRTVPRNGHLVHAGEPLTSLFIVNSGSVKTTMPDEDGRAQLIGFSLPGELVGMDAIATGRYPDDIVALEHTSFCSIRYSDLVRLSADLPALQHFFHQSLSREITRDHDLMLMLGSMTAEERFVVFLLNMLRRYAERGYSKTRLRLSMTRRDIASYLGLKLETVSRLLTHLRDRRLLDVNGRDITILDNASLQRIADGAAPRGVWMKKRAAAAT